MTCLAKDARSLPLFGLLCPKGARAGSIVDGIGTGETNFTGLLCLGHGSGYVEARFRGKTTRLELLILVMAM